MKKNDCKNCKHYDHKGYRCEGGHQYDGTVKSALNSAIDIECKEFEPRGTKCM